MLPARCAPYLFGLILSGMMSCIVTGIATLKALGPGAGFLASWMASWSFSWPVAFLVVLVVAPFTRRIVSKLVKSDG